ncbi:MAG: hypothetical protein M1820_002504 [Bogoriella megaspora]|nr:MAG: hypothetical protein M1820_002504 [Bogoriella megaspora]
MAWSDPGYPYTYNSYTESWIEVASNPSASSLSSAGGDDIVTTGLRVQHDIARQRRQPRPTAHHYLETGQRPRSAEGSSQDEYEESESESDRVMSSSNEGLQVPSLLPSPQRPYSSSEDGASEAVSDDDENSTAINYRPSDTCFTPQPNAFSHPPGQHSSAPQSVPGSYFPQTNRPVNRNSVQRHSYSHPRQQHSPFNVISPSHQADHDAALRASLSTLLSCAAAARGLPKSSTRSNTAAPQQSNRIDANTLRLVPESVALGQSNPASSPGEPTFNPTLPRPSSPSRTTSSESKNSTTAASKNAKRKAGANTSGTVNAPNSGRSSSKDRRASKKPRRSANTAAHWASTSGDVNDLNISPTLLTWVVSAGVVVLVSALSFGAGFSMGREAGRVEVLGLDGLGAEGGLRNASESLIGCGREAGSWGGGGGWRGRLKWSGIMGASGGVVA